MHTRREFARTVGLGTIGPGLPPSIIDAQQSATALAPIKDPKYRNWSDDALHEAKRLGCSYADIRFTLNRGSSPILIRRVMVGAAFS